MQGQVPRSVRAFFPDAKPFKPAKKKNVALDKIDQIAIVTDDLEHLMDHLSTVLGWGPFYVIPEVKGKAGCRGEQGEYRLRLAFVQVGPIEIELVEPLEGNTPYSEHLTKHGPGLLHLRIGTVDLLGDLEHLANHGIPSIWECWDQNILINAHTDTHSKFGLRTELILNKEALDFSGFDAQGETRAITYRTL